MEGAEPVVVENEENLLKQLENFLRNDCKSFGVYKDNINSAFVFKDGRCCERIYKILNKDIYGANSNFNGM